MSNNYRVISAAIMVEERPDLLDALKNEIIKKGVNPDEVTDAPGWAGGNQRVVQTPLTAAEWQRTAAQIIYSRNAGFGASVGKYDITPSLREAIENL